MWDFLIDDTVRRYMQYVVCLGINKFPVREMRHVLSKWHPVVEESEDLHPFFLYWFPQCLKRITRNNSLNDLNGFNSIQAIFWFLISFLECIVTYFLLVYIFKANIKIWNLKSVTLKTYSSFHSLSFFFISHEFTLKTNLEYLKFKFSSSIN